MLLMLIFPANPLYPVKKVNYFIAELIIRY